MLRKALGTITFVLVCATLAWAQGFWPYQMESTDSPADTEALTYNGATGKFQWDPMAVGSGDITDVFDCATGNCADIVVGATDSLDFSGVDANAAGEGLVLPQTTSCGGAGIATGAICYGTTSDNLCVWDGAAWDCQTLGASGSSIILDFGDDGGNDSTALSEIATTGDTNNIFTEPSADKLLIAVGNDWPKADTADDLTCTNCIDDTEVTTHAGTALSADLEEETHAGEHSLGGGDAITATDLASACSDGQVLGGTGAGTGVECQADDDDPETVDWTTLQNYPTGCDPGDFVTAVGDTLTCDTPTGTGDITDVFDCGSGNCADIAVGATDSLDFSAVDADAAGEGLILPQTTTCGGAGQASGSTCYQTTGDALCVWDGAAWDCQTLGVTQVTDTGPGPDCSGTSTYQDGEAGCDTVGGDATGGLDVLDVTEADSIDADDDGTKELRADGTFIYLDPNDSGSGTPEALVYKTGANGGNMSLLDNDTATSLFEASRWHASCTNADVGTEDCDTYLIGKEDGAEVAILTYDADAGITYGAATVNSHTFASDGTGTGEFVIPNDGITLTTETDGVYVAQVADGTGVDGTANAEGATYTPTLDLTEITCGDNVTCAATEIDWDGMQMSNAGTDQGVFNGLEFGSDFSFAKDMACVGGSEPGTICDDNTDCADSGTCTADKRATISAGAGMYKQGTVIQSADLPMAALAKTLNFHSWCDTAGTTSTSKQYLPIGADGNNAGVCGFAVEANAVPIGTTPLDCTLTDLSCCTSTALSAAQTVDCTMEDRTGTTGSLSCQIPNSGTCCVVNSGAVNVDASDTLRGSLTANGSIGARKFTIHALCVER